MLTEAKTVADEYWSLIQEQDAELTKQRTTIAQQKADIEALVAYVWQVDRAEDIVGNEAEILRCRAAIEPIIRRWVGGDD
jgi:hypothetical protein